MLQAQQLLAGDTGDVVFILFIPRAETVNPSSSIGPLVLFLPLIFQDEVQVKTRCLIKESRDVAIKQLTEPPLPHAPLRLSEPIAKTSTVLVGPAGEQQRVDAWAEKGALSAAPKQLRFCPAHRPLLSCSFGEVTIKF